MDDHPGSATAWVWPRAQFRNNEKTRNQAGPIPSATAQVTVLSPQLTIPGLNRQRTVRIYMPPGYATSTKRYPVLYMHEGEKLFDDATAYAGEWGVDETLDALAQSQGLELIVVGT